MTLRMSIWLVFLLLAVSLSGATAEATLAYFPNITDLTSNCYPQGFKLTSERIEGVDWPSAHDHALFGMFALGDGQYPVMIDRYDDGVDLYVDSNLSGDLHPVPWDRALSDGTSLASIPFVVQYATAQTSSYQAYLMWSGFTPTVLMSCRDSYRAGEIKLGDVSYSLAVFDEDTDAHYDDLEAGTFAIDSDGDGELLMTSDSHEVFALTEPFNIGGVVYEVAAVAADGSWIQVIESDAKVEPRYPLLNGYPAPVFEGTDVLGELLSLGSLRGEIVVLDFWASWCAPCIFELATLESIAAEFADQGVRVIGINMDRSESLFQSALETYEIGYEQIYDSDRGPIGDLYRIEGIPMTYVIDREGTIAARGLRGDSLIEAIEHLLDREE